MNETGNKAPRTQTAAQGKPPRPPKRTVRGCADSSDDPEEQMLITRNGKVIAVMSPRKQ